MCGGRRRCCFSRSRASTFGRGAALAWRILSAVQYLMLSSEEVSTECLMIVVEESGFEKRFHASKYTPTSTQRRIVPTRGTWISLCFRNIMPLSFRNDRTDRTRVQGIMHVVFLPALSRSSFFSVLGSCFLYSIHDDRKGHHVYYIRCLRRPMHAYIVVMTLAVIMARMGTRRIEFSLPPLYSHRWENDTSNQTE